MGGLAIVLGLIASSATLMFAWPQLKVKAAALILTVLIAAGIGVIDEYRPFRALEKVLALTLAAIPIIALNVYYPYPQLPFIGSLRLTIIYPYILVPLMVTALANTINMVDVLNGSMALTSTISAAFLTLASAMLGRWEILPLTASLAACTIAFYRHNRFPAKVFAGDVGSLSVGAGFAAVAIMGRLEVLVAVALIPALINSGLIVSSLRRLMERREIKFRPTIVKEGKIFASGDPRAPLTLVRLLAASKPRSEPEIVRLMAGLTVFSGILTLITALLLMV